MSHWIQTNNQCQKCPTFYFSNMKLRVIPNLINLSREPILYNFFFFWQKINQKGLLGIMLFNNSCPSCSKIIENWMYEKDDRIPELSLWTLRNGLQCYFGWQYVCYHEYRLLAWHKEQGQKSSKLHLQRWNKKLGCETGRFYNSIDFYFNYYNFHFRHSLTVIMCAVVYVWGLRHVCVMAHM